MMNAENDLDVSGFRLIVTLSRHFPDGTKENHENISG
jgi:hypothetical protein